MTVARRTKIVATLGPASSTPAALDSLLAAGVDVVRINLSHGPVEDHVARLHAVRAAAKRLGRPIGILADLPGPKVRAGQFPEGGTMLPEGSIVHLTPGKGASSASEITVDYETLLSDLAAGDRVVLGDGAITLRIQSVDASSAVGKVESGGLTQGRPGVHIPAERLRLHTPTTRDLELAVIMAAEGVDFLAVSFVRAGADLRRVRDELKGGHMPRLIAKIETANAVVALDEILAESDAVMVARGDLGIDCPLSEVPHLQKRIIRKCVQAGIPVITATQMLESMITSPAPTRAEVSDVANAVFDGTDAVMLSGETAIGDDPSLVVRTMSEICHRAESEASYRQWANRLGRSQREHVSDRGERITNAVTHAGWQAAEDTDAAAIICCTRSGKTAMAMSRYRPPAQLIGASPDDHTIAILTLSWGVIPLKVDVHPNTDDMVWFAVQKSVSASLAEPGDVVVVLAGTPDQAHHATDVMRIVEIT
jgi:pyruvate kinase